MDCERREEETRYADDSPLDLSLKSTLTDDEEPLDLSFKSTETNEEGPLDQSFKSIGLETDEECPLELSFKSIEGEGPFHGFFNPEDVERTPRHSSVESESAENRNKAEKSPGGTSFRSRRENASSENQLFPSNTPIEASEATHPSGTVRPECDSYEPQPHCSYQERPVERRRVNNPVVCNYCDLICESEKIFEMHVLQHKDEDKVYTCSKCNYSSKEKYDLETHKRTHKRIEKKREKLYTCPVCSFTTAVESHLTVHKRAHIDKEVKCNFCPYTSLRKHVLQQHMKVHSQDAQYKCNFCSASYNRKSSLSNHKRLHTK
ncbi:zinc finger protein 382-like isoform X2 [Palaemon carinicauda]